MNELGKAPDVGITEDVAGSLLPQEAAHPSESDLDIIGRLREIATHFVRELDIEAVFGEIVDAAVAIAGADFGSIQLLDPKTGDLSIVAQRGFPPWWLDFWRAAGKGKGASGIALERGERVIVEDIERSPIFAGTPALEIQLRAGVRAVQSTPLISRSGAPLGVFSIHYNTPHRPDERILGLLDLLAIQASDMIERDKAERVLTAGRAMLEVAEDHERRRIARDLQDNLAQTLVAVELPLARLCAHDLEDVRATAGEIAVLIAHAGRWTQSLAAQLAPAALYELGLSAALERLAEEMKQTIGLTVALVDDGQSLGNPLSQQARSIVYRVVRELLINLARHSKANQATVETLSVDDQVILTVADRGIDFETSHMATMSGRLGLVGVRELLSCIGATCELQSSPGNGTSARLTIPLAQGPSGARQAC